MTRVSPIKTRFKQMKKRKAATFVDKGGKN